MFFHHLNLEGFMATFLATVQEISMLLFPFFALLWNQNFLYSVTLILLTTFFKGTARLKYEV
jgi:hypothetical protein